MNIKDIDKIYKSSTVDVNTIRNLVELCRGQILALDAYVHLRTGLGGSSDSFLDEVESISENIKKSCDELSQMAKMFNVMHPRKKTALEMLKPHITELKRTQSDITSLVRKGW